MKIGIHNLRLSVAFSRGNHLLARFPTDQKDGILAIETHGTAKILGGARNVDIEAIKTHVRNGKFVFSAHADQEAADEGIDIAEIRDALLAGEILEEYENTGRGESCLILGFANGKPIHVVCGWHRESVAIITVYIPKPPKVDDPLTRRRSL